MTTFYVPPKKTYICLIWTRKLSVTPNIWWKEHLVAIDIPFNVSKVQSFRILRTSVLFGISSTEKAIASSPSKIKFNMMTHLSRFPRLGVVWLWVLIFHCVGMSLMGVWIGLLAPSSFEVPSNSPSNPAAKTGGDFAIVMVKCPVTSRILASFFFNLHQLIW